MTLLTAPCAAPLQGREVFANMSYKHLVPPEPETGVTQLFHPDRVMQQFSHSETVSGSSTMSNTPVSKIAPLTVRLSAAIKFSGRYIESDIFGSSLK